MTLTRLLPVTAIVVSATVLLVGQGPEGGPPRMVPSQQPQARFRAAIELVPLSVTARDTEGRLIHDLRQDEFEVFEEGDRQEVSHFAHHEAPISVVVLLDRSGSMAGEKLMHAKDGVVAFVKALRPADEVLLVAFSDTIQALGDFRLDRRLVQREIERIDVVGGTRLYDAVVSASTTISTPERHEKRALLILSDGADTASSVALDQAVGAVRAAGVPVYGIGIEMAAEPSTDTRLSLWRSLEPAGGVAALKRLSDGTGGWIYPIEAARRCKEICLRVAEELRNQYLLAFYPSDQRREGGWRRITVRTTRAGVALTTRDGYFAPSRSS